MHLERLFAIRPARRACSYLLIVGALTLWACASEDYAILDEALLQPADLGSEWISSTPPEIDPSPRSGHVLQSACKTRAANSRNLARQSSKGNIPVVQQTTMLLTRASARTCLEEVRARVEAVGATIIPRPTTGNPMLSWTVPYSGREGEALFVFIQRREVATVLNFGAVDQVNEPPEVAQVISAADDRLTQVVSLED